MSGNLPKRPEYSKKYPNFPAFIPGGCTGQQTPWHQRKWCRRSEEPKHRFFSSAHHRLRPLLLGDLLLLGDVNHLGVVQHLDDVEHLDLNHTPNSQINSTLEVICPLSTKKFDSANGKEPWWCSWPDSDVLGLRVWCFVKEVNRNGKLRENKSDSKSQQQILSVVEDKS